MDEFSDDGLDDLNDTALQELENTAIQFTQAHKPTFSQHSQYNEFEADDLDHLDNTVVIDELAQAPARRPAEPLPPQRVVPTIAGPQQWKHRSGYVPGPAATPLPAAQYRHQHRPPGPPPSARQTDTGPNVGRFPRPTPQGQPPSNSQNDIVTQMQARLRELEGDLYTARGEASLMRSKLNDERKTHDAERARMKKQHAEQLAQQERLAEAAVAAGKTATTELEFTRQDLQEELDRNKKVRKESGALTPRKGAGGRTKTWDLADGFDDVEILPSPSKGQARRVKDPGPIAGPMFERTPTKGKRKRPAFDSPVLALETHFGEEEIPAQSHVAPLESMGSNWRPNALPFDFLQLTLDHAGFQGQPLTFDRLSRYQFPSNPAASFASIIFEKLPQLGTPNDPTQLLVDFCELILDLWSQCLREKYYKPLDDLLSLLSFVLQLNTVAVAPRVISSLVTITQTTIYLEAVPIFNNAYEEPLDDELADLVEWIDVSGCLGLLYLTASGCISALPDPIDHASDPSALIRDTPQRRFWSLIALEFILVMLSSKHAPDEYLGIILLLRTSVLPDSIGPITNDPSKPPAFIASTIIDRISYQLTDPPRWAPRNSYRESQVRLAVLDTLASFLRSPFGRRHLAASAVAIPRLVTTLSAAIDALYDMDAPHGLHAPAPPPRDAASGFTPRTAAAPARDAVPLQLRVVDAAMLLLHTLVTDPDPAVGAVAAVPAKLTAFQGGYQRYLLALARLSFSEEGLVLEAGIDPETVEMAHGLLELAVTPDEAEGVGEVFEVM